ncbi:MAG: Cna B domain-containing protein, partial [Methanosaeta sp. ASM2]
MQKSKSRYKNESTFVFQKKHLNLFSVLAVLMMGGIFLALSASAAEDWPFDVAENDQAALDSDMTMDAMAPAANQPPTVTELESDKSSPQEVGSTIKWTARAEDPEKEPLSYLFQVKGPYTQGAWRTMADWSSDKSFIWDTGSYSAGDYEIRVQVADQSMGEAEKIAYFRLDETEPSPQVNVVPVEEETFVPNPVVSPYPEQTSNPDQTPYQEPTIVPQEQAPQNQPPTLSSLLPDKESPQQTGSTVAWTASAEDLEGDPISYRFLLNGTPVSDWQTEGQWIWTAGEPGTSTVTVQAKDSQHDGPQGESGNLSRDFTITSPAPVMAEEEAPLAAENETENETGREQPLNETGPVPFVPPVLAENITTQQPENETNATNETGLLTPSPETVEPEEENLTTPVTAENVTAVEPANETEAAKVEPVAANQTPVLNSLTADLSSPQIPGSSITWTADASDAENDSLSYRFYLSGPATGGEWQVAADWSASNSWIQKTTTSDAGENQVKVQIRDGKHAAEDGYDSEATALFTINEQLLNISGTAYQDKNGNIILDDGEALSGWTIKLTLPDGSELSALTGADGAYRFQQLKAGSYKVGPEIPSGWSVEPASGSYDVDLQGADVSDRNFVGKLSAFSISGMKYNDLDGNGVKDGEPGMEGWTIKLSGTTLDNQAVEKEVATAADGSYKFESLSPGTYAVSEVEQFGWKKTAPAEGTYTVSLSDADVSDKDFGNHGSWSISGSVFLDSNGNGAKDADEAAQAGWSVQLSRDGAVINATTTGQDGTYAFKNLAPGQYTISQAAQEGWKISLPAEGSYSVDLANADVVGKDFGITGDLTISGQKYYDINGNGAQDADEPGIPGGDVSLVLDGKVVANTTTDDNGVYTFDNILPGTYTINDPVPSGLVLTTPSTVTVTPTGSTVAKANFGLVGMNAISGMKFNDKNGNGAKDAGEGESGWDIVLTGNTWFGKPLQPRTTTTAPDGSYKFDKLIPGSYKVSETSRTGWTQISPAGGSHTVDFIFRSPP